MKSLKLGSQGLVVSVEGLGCMGMSSAYGVGDELESLATLQRALELGVTFFDTAEGYGPFVNERLISRAIEGKRTQLVLATKTGIEIADDGSFVGLNGSPAYLRKALDRSLKNLRTDYVDLYYLHRLDPKVPVEESVGCLREFVQAGKVRYIGLSEVLFPCETSARGNNQPVPLRRRTSGSNLGR